ncbi:hypothetical protein DYB32_006956 [Aphanomyces invadans]|uniref:TRP C-terminal domain-containing protein n=1 Tax=Aphanomyces invadans TaxID=157072 RepID=A0A418AXW0_9STRA|nr:hypothetical protein DYB32_006956 [Aphanomyces invadans]
MPPPDLFSIGLLFDYLQFLASTGHMEMPGAPPFYFEFTDSLAWTMFHLPRPANGTASPTTHKRSIHLEDGDIVAGVLAYAERLHILPDTLFVTTATGLACVVVGVVLLVSVAYGFVTACATKRFNLVKQQLAAELPTSHLFLRCVIQSALGVALLAEYALSMTSSFQLRYGGASAIAAGSFYGATVALSVVCCGLLVLGMCLLRGKSEAQLNDPTFKFSYGAYYKYYSFEHRYFFVAKMGSEIASGVIIGRVEDVPTQLTLLLTLQFGMFLYTTHCSPYVLEFQSIAAATAFVTYVLLSSFVTTSVSQDVQEVAGTVSLVLQIALLLLFNSRQLHILYKQIKCLVVRRRRRRLVLKAKAAEAAMLAAEMERLSSVGTIDTDRWIVEGYRPAA